MYLFVFTCSEMKDRTNLKLKSCFKLMPKNGYCLEEDLGWFLLLKSCSQALTFISWSVLNTVLVSTEKQQIHKARTVIVFCCQ